MLTNSSLFAVPQNPADSLRIQGVRRTAVSGFYSSNQHFGLEKPQTYNTLSDEYSTILDKQKAIMKTYAMMNGGKLPPKKNIKATGGVLGDVRDILNSNSMSDSVYQQHYNLADMLLEGGNFRFGNLNGGNVNAGAIAAQPNGGRFGVPGGDTPDKDTPEGDTPDGDTPGDDPQNPSGNPDLNPPFYSHPPKYAQPPKGFPPMKYSYGPDIESERTKGFMQDALKLSVEEYEKEKEMRKHGFDPHDPGSVARFALIKEREFDSSGLESDLMDHVQPQVLPALRMAFQNISAVREAANIQNVDPSRDQKKLFTTGIQSLANSQMNPGGIRNISNMQISNEISNLANWAGSNIDFGGGQLNPQQPAAIANAMMISGSNLGAQIQVQPPSGIIEEEEKKGGDEDMKADDGGDPGKTVSAAVLDKKVFKEDSGSIMVPQASAMIQAPGSMAHMIQQSSAANPFLAPKMINRGRRFEMGLGEHNPYVLGSDYFSSAGSDASASHFRAGILVNLMKDFRDVSDQIYALSKAGDKDGIDKVLEPFVIRIGDLGTSNLDQLIMQTGHQQNPNLDFIKRAVSLAMNRKLIPGSYGNAIAAQSLYEKKRYLQARKKM